MLASDADTRSRRRRSPRLVWTGLRPRLALPVLFASAALFGASIAAVAFVGFWQRADSHRQNAESALLALRRQLTLFHADNVRLTGKSAALASDLAAARAQLAAAARELATTRRRLATDASQAAAKRVALLRRNQALLAQTARLEQNANTLVADAATVAGPAMRLGNDLASLDSYLSQTATTSLDPAFLRAQLSYLKRVAATIPTRAASLTSDAQRLRSERG